MPAIIRKDLDRLTSYISQENDKVRSSRTVVPSHDYDVNRIVLYVDDLDRCPDDKVIKVLQAVHLLLAFELFIVVVAVDSKWLSHALMTQYPALGLPEDASLDRPQARPRDYLEKIFQVPFFVRPLGDDGRKSIVRGLLGDHLRQEGPEPGSGRDAVTSRRLGDRESVVLDQQVGPRHPPASLATKAFSLTLDELTFLESLSPLLGDTPRAVKRFVNLFQLLRVLLVDDDVGPGGVRDTELAAFLLAVGNTDPDFAARLLATPPQTFQALTGSTPVLAPVPTPVVAWLTTHGPKTPWLKVAREQIERLADVVERFSFG